MVLLHPQPCTVTQGMHAPYLCVTSRLLKLDVNSAKQVIVGDGQTESLPFFSTELSPEAQEVRLSGNMRRYAWMSAGCGVSG